jgi:hypothetical protein
MVQTDQTVQSIHKIFNAGPWPSSVRLRIHQIWIHDPQLHAPCGFEVESTP